MGAISDTSPGRVRVVSYNVHSCIGTDGQFSPDRIVDVLRDLEGDFIALQEVEERAFRGKPVSRFLAEALGLHLAGRTTHKRAGLDYGNALLSRWPANRSIAHDIAFLRREPRGVIEAEFDFGERSLCLIATHFGLTMRERRAQLDQLLEIVGRRSDDLVVVCADFNEWAPWSRTHRRLREVLGRAPALRTFPSRFATLPLDRIYAAPSRALVDLRTVTTADARIASDHLPLVADLELA